MAVVGQIDCGGKKVVASHYIPPPTPGIPVQSSRRYTQMYGSREIRAEAMEAVANLFDA